MNSEPAVVSAAPPVAGVALRRRIRERVPSTRAVCVGVLRGHELRWHKVGQDGSGKCDVVESVLPGEQVHGVVYEIAASEKPRLDKAEGLGAGYEEKQVVVETSAGPISALVYYATKVDASWVPDGQGRFGRIACLP